MPRNNAKVMLAPEACRRDYKNEDALAVENSTQRNGNDDHSKVVVLVLDWCYG